MYASIKNGVVLAAALCLAGGCKKNQAPPEEDGSIFRDSGMSGPANVQHGSQGLKTIPIGPVVPGEAPDKSAPSRAYQLCKELRPVTRGDPKTAEGTLYLVFAALLLPDPEESFTAFYSYIDPDFQRQEDARRYWFAAARKDGSKNFLRLVYGPNDPTYVVCETRPEGQDAVRIFVGKSPPVGSNPPFVLHKVGDRWLIKSFTPN